MKTFSVNISYFIDFHRFFGLFNIFLVPKKQMIRLGFLEIWKYKRLEGGANWSHSQKKLHSKRQVLLGLMNPDIYTKKYFIQNPL